MSLTAMPQTNTGRPTVTPSEPRAAVDPRRISVFERWPAYFAITFAGIAGFIGMLVASHYWPQWGQGLRIAALIWFAWFGVVRLATAGPR